MTAETRALFRQTILEQLASASAMGLPVATIATGCKLRGFMEAHADTVEAELAGFLAANGYVSCKANAMNAAVSRWILTGAGRHFLESQGLA